MVDEKLHGHPAHASLFHTLLAGIAYEFDEIGPAVDHIERAMSSIDEYGPADALIVAYLTRARLQHLRHDEGSALAILREGQELGERRGLRRVTVTLGAEECNTLARGARFDDARVVAARFGFNAMPSQNSNSDLAADKAFRAASRYLLQQSPKLVVQALGGAIDYCEARNLAHRWVELLLLRALAYKQYDEWASALADLQKALAIAAPRRYLRIFLDEGVDLRPLIDRLDLERLRGSEAAPLARQLKHSMRKPDDQGAVSGRGAAAALEELTKREVAILKRLESGLSNKEIAEAIFISEGTLKWHLHNVYGKLDVKNRSGAMTRARALGIL
jgi:ATP/maltotriose-dependent transcriptional regulator MalT